MAYRKKAMSATDFTHTLNSLQSHSVQHSHVHHQYHNPYDTSWVDNLLEVDFLIKEYLIFRGYHKTWEQFYRERKRDQTKNKNIGGYQVDLIVDQLIGYIRNLKLSEYLDFWNTLNLRIFNKLPPQYRESIYHLDTALKRYYLITARKRNNLSSIQAFFNKFGDELISRPDANDWMKWFVLPHIKHPEKHQEFESYFNKNWSYSVQISLKNFLSTALCRFPRPKILAFMILKQERQEFKATIAKLKEKLNDADFIIRSLHQQLTALNHNKENNNDDEYETNKLINKAIQQYQSDSIHGGCDIINEHNHKSPPNHNHSAAPRAQPKTRHNRAQSANNAQDVDAASLQINEKYFRTGTSPQIQPHKHSPQSRLNETLKQNRHRKTLPEDEENDNNDDVKAFNDNILFNARPLTPTRGSKSGLFKWFRGKTQELDRDKAVEVPKLPQTEEILTPVHSINDIQPQNREHNAPHEPPPHVSQQQRNQIPAMGQLPPLLSAELYQKEITMKTIFVPGVAINSVSFNDNGQRLAYSTQAGVIQVYQFPIINHNNNNNNEGDTKEIESAVANSVNSSESTENKERLSPSLLHTFCVSKPNEILQLIWDTMDENRLFIAIGNPSNSKKHDDHIQIWNVWDKKCEYIISFGSNVECPSIECIKCHEMRLIVSGVNKHKRQCMLYLYCDEQDENEWSLISTSNLLNNCNITCVEFNHNGKIVYVGGSDGYIRIFDIQLSGSHFTQLAKWCAHYGSIHSLHLCHDANSILSIATDFIVKHWLLNGKDHNNSCKKVWKISSSNSASQLQKSSEQNDGSNNEGNSEHIGNEQSEIVPLLCLGPNNYFAVTQSNAICNNNESKKKDDNIYNVTIKCIDADATNNAHDIMVGGHSKIITAIDWHKESKMLATCSVDGTLRIFQIFRN